MKATHTCPRVGVRRETRAAAPRLQDLNPRGGRTAGDSQEGRTGAAAWRAPAGLAVCEAGGPAAGRPLNLFLGHFGTHTRGTRIQRDVNLLSLTHGDPDNHGAAPGAAQVRSGRVCGVAWDLAQCPDGRRTAGLPGWAYSLGLPAGAACGARSVTRYGNPGRAPCPAGPARSGLQSPAQPEAPLPLRQWSALEALPRQALSASRASGEGVPHG